MAETAQGGNGFQIIQVQYRQQKINFKVVDKTRYGRKIERKNNIIRHGKHNNYRNIKNIKFEVYVLFYLNLVSSIRSGLL
jgi:hypothetical protein